MAESAIAGHTEHFTLCAASSNPGSQRHGEPPTEPRQATRRYEALPGLFYLDAVRDPDGRIARVCHDDVVLEELAVQFRHHALRPDWRVLALAYRLGFGKMALAARLDRCHQCRSVLRTSGVLGASVTQGNERELRVTHESNRFVIPADLVTVHVVVDIGRARRE